MLVRAFTCTGPYAVLIVMGIKVACVTVSTPKISKNSLRKDCAWLFSS